jgi:glutathione S-transferase
MASPNTDLVLYYFPHSFYSQKVVMYLHEKKIPFRTKLVNINTGKQFTPEFLAMSPRGEVPVLVDQNTRTIPDSQKIIDYLEDNFSNGNQKLVPNDPELKTRCEQLNHQIHALKVESLTYGSSMFNRMDLGVNPKFPFNTPKARQQMQDVVTHRVAVLRSQIKLFPQYAGVLNQKIAEIEEDMALIRNRDKYESLLLQFEKVLDECEAELSTHEDQNWWLVSSKITIADISLAILLHRLWQLGFEFRMWERSRPTLAFYYKRIQRNASFQKAISMSTEFNFSEFLKSPMGMGAVGFIAITAIALGGYYVWKNVDSSRFGFLNLFGVGKKRVPPHLRDIRFTEARQRYSP